MVYKIEISDIKLSAARNLIIYENWGNSTL